ncbi:hypothetical protein CN376_22875 [Bacillus cereus]|uniref:hypothetical protein n=1 Tax=Bacillus cereus TaxID=1396 RepID=UPI000BF282AD|nr:hypothetical protein [Bacillus cereus]PEZ87927.1 hypothetical protein CN376_22875 [Bacillus cereus]PFR12645.1 hypothetical protein COK30_13945 [Bacillus cereus]
MSKADELKVYTGKETLQALLEGKVLQRISTSSLYKIEDKHLSLKQPEDKEFSKAYNGMSELMNYEFTEVVTPQVGDWVRVTCESGKTYTGKLTSVSNEGMKAKWNDNDYVGYLKFKSRAWQILSPEEVSEYKREQAFAKVGRKLNEFKADDLALINSTSEVAVVVSNNNDESVRLHVLNQGGKGYTAKSHQLTPISFVEQQVDLS